MKALVLQAPDQPLTVEARDAVEPPPGHVVVEIEAAAVNRRDFWITQGKYPGITFPVVLGSDGAGKVKRCGPDADSAWLEREVIIDPGSDWGDDAAVQSADFSILGLPRDGTFATEVVVHASQLHPKPEHLNWAEAAALPLAGVTAYRAAFSQGHLQAGQTVLITGIGGGVATFVLQFAVALGADVYVTSSSPAKLQKAIELGAKGGFDYRTEGWQKEMLRQSDAPHLIVDGAGGPGYQALISLIAPGGCIVNYGATAGPPRTLDLFKVFWKQLRLQGSTMGSPADFTAMLSFVNEHAIRPLVDRTFPLEDGNNALALMKSSPQFGKYVLLPK